MADAIDDKFGIKTELVKSGGGAFEVTVNGEKIFSKLQVGRFPENEEILSAIEKSRA